MKLITSNPGKYNEYQEYFKSHNLNVEWERMKYPEVQADSLEDVVNFSLDFLIAKGHNDFIIDDSGIYIDALKGFPGVYSAYVQSTLGNEGILKLMENQENREARFATVIGYYCNGTKELFRGEVRGYIAYSPRGERGFGYDPIFIPEGENETFAEMSITRKNAVSHRSKALQKLLAYLMKKEI